MTTEKAPQGCWVVLDEKGWPIHCAGWPEACHEHINDAINEHGLTEAAKWRVVEMKPAEPAPTPAPAPGPQVEIDPDDKEAWAKVDNYLRKQVANNLTFDDVDFDWTTLQYVDEGLQVNAIVSFAVPVEVYRS